MAWSISIPVRTYELDTLGHVNQAVYHQYAEVARVEAFKAAGCGWETMVHSGSAPVLLSSTCHYRRELRLGETVEVTASIKFGTGKTFTMESLVLKADGTTSAEITCVIGVMDLTARKLLADPRAALEAAGMDLSVLGE